jgi:hypothetical protein
VWPGYSAKFSPGSTLVIAVSFRVGCRDLTARFTYMYLTQDNSNRYRNQYRFLSPSQLQTLGAVLGQKGINTYSGLLGFSLGFFTA